MDLADKAQDASLHELTPSTLDRHFEAVEGPSSASRPRAANIVSPVGANL